MSIQKPHLFHWDLLTRCVQDCSLMAHQHTGMPKKCALRIRVGDQSDGKQVGHLIASESLWIHVTDFIQLKFKKRKGVSLDLDTGIESSLYNCCSPLNCSLFVPLLPLNYQQTTPFTTLPGSVQSILVACMEPLAVSLDGCVVHNGSAMFVPLLTAGCQICYHKWLIIGLSHQ